jgi:hypothetical protein
MIIPATLRRWAGVVGTPVIAAVNPGYPGSLSPSRRQEARLHRYSPGGEYDGNEYGGLPVLRFVNYVTAHHISRLTYLATGAVCPVYCCRVTGFDLSAFPPLIDIFDSSDKSLGPARTVDFAS